MSMWAVWLGASCLNSVRIRASQLHCAPQRAPQSTNSGSFREDISFTVASGPSPSSLSSDEELEVAPVLFLFFFFFSEAALGVLEETLGSRCN